MPTCPVKRSCLRDVSFMALLAAAAPGCDSGSPLGETTDALYVLSSAVWSPSQLPIPVCWEEAGDDAAKQLIRGAIADSWEAASSVVRFSGWGRCTDKTNAGLRVVVRDAFAYTSGLGNQLDNVRNGVHLNSWASRECGLPEPTKGAKDRCIISTAVHEFGHALGFAHEQNRPDTPDTCKQAPQGGNGDSTVGNWDQMSVMNYCNPVRNANGHLSANDARGLRQFYDDRARADGGH
jgi:hypothetical protein